jgi:methyl-accepting chemotaxis protein
LSQGTEQQASNFEETTAAISEITETVQETAESTKHARAVVADAQSEGETSGEIARHTVEAMRKIERSSKEIGDIIGMIDEIAFQTNLLALNAGIEAARAGESGRGFAVVASEVRALAQRSADAAKQIKVLIATSSGEVDNGVKLVAQTSDSLARIVTKVSEIDAVVAEIATSAMGQAAGLQVVNNAVVKMNEVMTQQNAAVGQQVTAASQSLFLEIEELSELVAQFRVHRSDEGNTIQRARAA